jgi:hypothetical protein
VGQLGGDAPQGERLAGPGRSKRKLTGSQYPLQAGAVALQALQGHIDLLAGAGGLARQQCLEIGQLPLPGAGPQRRPQAQGGFQLLPGALRVGVEVHRSVGGNGKGQFGTRPRRPGRS